jgi:hypothetical protein
MVLNQGLTSLRCRLPMLPRHPLDARCGRDHASLPMQSA